MSNFFSELRRRNVFRVGIAYLVTAWLVVQVADTILNNIDAPTWVIQAIMLVLALGLVFAVFFAWAFEVTPEGLKRESEVDRSASTTTQTGRRLDRAIIVLLAVAIGVVAVDRWLPENGKPAEPVNTILDQSIAVLPFADLSSGNADTYLGQGLAEELLNALAQFPALRVAARTSAFAVAKDGLDLREVGEALGVAYVLEGSIRRSGDRLRITAQLIRASDGFHLWSETYERAMTDIFAIQDEIVRELSLVLQVRLGVGAGAHRASGRHFEPRAYDSYLRGLQYWSNRHTDTDRIAAIRSFRLATEIDPGLADAWAAYALSLMHSDAAPETSGISRAEWLPTVQNALLTALELDPDLARAHAGLSLYYGRAVIDVERSIHHADRALALAPNSAPVRYSRASAALVRGDNELAQREMTHARLLDPLNIVIARVEATNNMILGRLAQARSFVEECLQTDCEGVWSRRNMITYALFTGDHALAETLVAEYERIALDPTAAEHRDIRMQMITEGVIAPFRCDDAFVEAIRDRDLQMRLSVNFSNLVLGCLLRRGDLETAAESMLHTSHLHGYFNASEMLLELSPGPLEFPEEFRKHPRYHDFWARPGYRELAAERIANGHPEGLPLNEDGSLFDFRASP